MRVSRIGFVLIELVEYPRRPLDALRTLAKMVLRRRHLVDDLFEPVGNYIYRVSERDIVRMQVAAQIRWFAIKTFNNFSSQWLASQRLDALLARLVFRIGVGVQDILSLCPFDESWDVRGVCADQRD